MTPAKGAELALLVICAMDMRIAEPASLAPRPDPRLAGMGWRILGYVTGTDAILRSGGRLEPGEPACYGFLAQFCADPSRYALAIRGTNGIIEWVEDAQFLPMPHPVAGKVETGFFTLYESLCLTMPGAPGKAIPLATGVAAAVGAGGRLSVVGHSLGAPLATYVAFDLGVPLGDRLTCALFASPRPGNAAFGAAFVARVKDCALWNYMLDVVPHVPIGPDYEGLPGAQWITPTTALARVGFSLDCHHHLVCYAAMLDYNLLDWTRVPSCDESLARCIKGPN